MRVVGWGLGSDDRGRMEGNRRMQCGELKMEEDSQKKGSLLSKHIWLCLQVANSMCWDGMC